MTKSNPIPEASARARQAWGRRPQVLFPSDQLPTSASSLRNVALFVVAAGCLLAGVLVFVVKLDIYAVAQARIQPIGRSKLVQAFETSKVRAVYVGNGSAVAAGTVLLEFDSQINEADRRGLIAQIAALDAQIARRRSAIALALQEESSAQRHREPGVPGPAAVGTSAVDAGALTAAVALLRVNLNASNIKIADNTVAAHTLRESILDQERLVKILTDRVTMHQELLKSGLGPRISVIDAQESLANALSHLTELRGEAARAAIAIDAAKLEAEALVRKFIEENSEGLVSAQSRRDELAESLVRARAKLSYARVVSPIRGTVQELAVTTVGQVVTGGQKLMTIVPADAPLEAEALIENKDIGVIRVDQPVILKIESFPFARYGTVSGRVTRIPRDAVPFPTLASNSGQELAYPVTVALDRVTVGSRGEAIPLLPGMNARAEIRIGSRRIIDYLLSPLREVSSEAIRER